MLIVWSSLFIFLVLLIGSASAARSYKSALLIIDWLFGWEVGNAVFSEKALRIFLIFCMKLGDYKGRKVTEPNFWKNLIWRYSQKGLQISPKSDTLIFFSKTALTIFLAFGLKLVLNMTFNLNDTYCAKLRFLAIFSTLLASLVFLDFAHNDRYAWCLASCFLTNCQFSQYIRVNFQIFSSGIRFSSIHSRPRVSPSTWWIVLRNSLFDYKSLFDFIFCWKE